MKDDKNFMQDIGLERENSILLEEVMDLSKHYTTLQEFTSSVVEYTEVMCLSVLLVGNPDIDEEQVSRLVEAHTASLYLLYKLLGNIPKGVYVPKRLLQVLSKMQEERE